MKGSLMKFNHVSTFSGEGHLVIISLKVWLAIKAEISFHGTSLSSHLSKIIP
jgi:hypothetical protein